MTSHPDDLDHAAEAAGTAIVDRLNETGWISALTAIADAIGRIADALQAMAEPPNDDALEAIASAVDRIADEMELARKELPGKTGEQT